MAHSAIGPLFRVKWWLAWSPYTVPDHEDDEALPPQIQDARPAPKWCLVAMPQTSSWSAPVRILALTEDCLEAAVGRGWMVVGKDSDVLTE